MQARRWRQHATKYHHIEIVEDMSDNDQDWSSTNPAIWETEPKEDVGMDIYYEASDAIPITINSSTNELFAPFGTLVNRDYNPFAGEYKVVSWSDNYVTLDNDLPGPIASGARVRFTRPDGFVSTAIITNPVDGNTGQPVLYPDDAFNVNVLKLRGWEQAAYPLALAYNNDAQHNQLYTLSWFNAYCFGNGIESDRIRDDYNQTKLANGVKASTVLAEQYKEDRRKTGLIHSGIYNSTSHVNQLNQFIAAEKITKDMNPQYGAIQKLHTRDSNIVVLHEDKCMKVLANKDALYNADGSKNVAISSKFLGSDEPFATRYGISTNPESCATDLHGRLYFADRTRGAVLRLSNDGVTNISDYGMKDWFGDNLGPLTRQILGSFDQKKEEYNITIKGLYPVGTSGINSGGDQCGCDTSTASTNQDPDDIRNLENTTILRNQDNLNIGNVSVGNSDFYNSEVTLSFSERAKGWISFKSFVPESGVSINNEYYTFKGGEMYKHHSNLNHNTFYEPLLGDDAFTESSVTLLFNDQPGTVKSFSTLNYEGSQARNKANLTDGEYSNLVERDGWYVSDIKTNLQESSYLEFTGKEDKWFTYIKGDTTTLQNLDEREFSVQGVGNYQNMAVVGEEAKQEVCLTITPNINCTPVPGCMDPDADNYDPDANVDDGSCEYPPEPVYGCMDSTASNYDSDATIDNGSCIWYGCMNPAATNYDPTATVDDGSCIVIEQVYGCTDPAADNYNSQATIDDGSCEIPESCNSCGDFLGGDYNISMTILTGTTGGTNAIQAVEDEIRTTPSLRAMHMDDMFGESDNTFVYGGGFTGPNGLRHFRVDAITISGHLGDQQVNFNKDPNNTAASPYLDPGPNPYGSLTFYKWNDMIGYFNACHAAGITGFATPVPPDITTLSLTLKMHQNPGATNPHINLWHGKCGVGPENC
jgi:hypothetical protein